MNSKALKQFKSVDFNLNVELKNQIDKEVAILKQVNNENVIRFFDFFTVFNTEIGYIYYLVTEFYQVFFFRFYANSIYNTTNISLKILIGGLFGQSHSRKGNKQTEL